MRRLKHISLFESFQEEPQYILNYIDNHRGEEKKLKVFNDYEKCLYYLFWLYKNHDEFDRRKNTKESTPLPGPNPFSSALGIPDGPRRIKVSKKDSPGEIGLGEFIYLSYLENPYDKDDQEKRSNILKTSNSWDEFLKNFEPQGSLEIIEYIYISTDNIDPSSDSFYPTMSSFDEIRQNQILLDMNNIPGGLDSLIPYSVYKKNPLLYVSGAS